MKHPINNTQAVNEFMQDLDHPFKQEVQLIRDIIKGVDKNITEEVKWNAPSFGYAGKDYIVTFNLWEKKRVHLVFHNPHISKINSELLEGNYEHRRMAYFSDMKDIETKKQALEEVIKGLLKLMDK